MNKKTFDPETCPHKNLADCYQGDCSDEQFYRCFPGVTGIEVTHALKKEGKKPSIVPISHSTGVTIRRDGTKHRIVVRGLKNKTRGIK